MNSILEELDDIFNKLEKSGADVAKLDELIQSMYEYDTGRQGYRCQLEDRGFCPHVIGEDADCYDNIDDCPIKKAGLYWCGENGELVDRDDCEDCNSNQDCGCCEYVQNGSAPYNCNVCGRLQVEIKNVGHYCVAPDTSPEEIERIKKEIEEDPGRYFSC